MNVFVKPLYIIFSLNLYSFDLIINNIGLPVKFDWYESASVNEFYNVNCETIFFR